MRDGRGNRREELDLAAAVAGTWIDALLDHLSEASSVASRRTRIDAVERAVQQADPGAITGTQQRRAVALGVPARCFSDAEFSLQPHAVRVPFVLGGVGRGGEAGFVRHMHAVVDPVVHGGYGLHFSTDAARAIADGFSAAQTLAPGHAQRPFQLTTSHPRAFAGAPGAVELRGPSLGAGAFVSAASLVTGRPVRAGIVVTGAIAGDRVQLAGGIAGKLAAVAACPGGITKLLVPSSTAGAARKRADALGLSLTVVGVRTLAELLDEALGPAPASDLPLRYRVLDARRAFEAGWREFGWHAVRDQIDRVLADIPDHNPDLLVDTMGMAGAAQGHFGMLDEGLALLEDAARIAARPDVRDGIPDAVLTRLHQRLAMTWRRLGRTVEARAAARKALSAAQRARMRDELYKSHGCAGLVEVSGGKPARAIEHYRASLHHVHAYAPESCVRTHAYLVHALGLAGDLASARQEYTLAQAHFAEHRMGVPRPTDDAWLRLCLAEGLLRAGQASEVLQLLDAPCVDHVIERAAVPGLLARRLRASALVRAGNAAEGYALLSPSLFAYGSDLSDGLLLTAQLNILTEAELRIEHGDWSRDIAGRVQRVLDRLPSYARAVAGVGLLQSAALRIDDPARLLPKLSQLGDKLTRVA